MKLLHPLIIEDRIRYGHADAFAASHPPVRGKLENVGIMNAWCPAIMQSCRIRSRAIAVYLYTFHASLLLYTLLCW